VAVEFTLEQVTPRSHRVCVHLCGDASRRLPVGEVHDNFGVVVAQVWGMEPVKSVTFGNIHDAASWVAHRAANSGKVLS
jgi:hypothetical protein